MNLQPSGAALDAFVTGIDLATPLTGKKLAAIESAIDRDRFPPRVGRLCDWCSFQDICPAFAGAAERLEAVAAAG